MNDAEQRLLLYRSGDRVLGIPLETVAEVLPAFELTGVPGLHDGVVGLVCLRGDILPVIGADIAGSARAIALTAQHKFIVVCSGARRLVLLAEHIDDIIEVSGEADSDPGYLSDHRGGIKRVIMHGEDMVFVLDMDRLIAATEVPPVEEFGTRDEVRETRTLSLNHHLDTG